MKYFGYILIGWIIWFVIYIPLSEKIENDKLKEIVEGNYTSTSMLINSNVYFTKNLEISFKDGKYSVHYDKYAKCYMINYYGDKDNVRSYTCIDNKETFIETIDSSGTYEILNEDELVLNLSSGTSRKCEIKKYSNTIDCSESGGWYYTKEK